MDIPRLSATCSPEVLASALDTAGCCVLENLAAEAQMDAIASELAVFRGSSSTGASKFEGFATRRTGAPLPRSATFQSLATHPQIMAAGNHVLGHATGWRFSAAEYIEIGQSEVAQRLHRDRWKYDMVEFGFEVELNGMWAVTEFTEKNGATRVIPESHLWGSDVAPKPHATVAAEMTKGSLFLYTGSLYHGGGANTSDHYRAGLSLQHAVSWLTQSTNQFLECPPEAVQDWPDDLLRFIGYAKAGNGLGYWRDSEDPLAAVHPKRTFQRGWATERPDGEEQALAGDGPTV